MSLHRLDILPSTRSQRKTKKLLTQGIRVYRIPRLCLAKLLNHSKSYRTHFHTLSIHRLQAGGMNPSLSLSLSLFGLPSQQLSSLCVAAGHCPSGRLQIPVHHPHLMRMGQGLGVRDRRFTGEHRSFERKATNRKLVFHQVWLTIGVLEPKQ